MPRGKTYVDWYIEKGRMTVAALRSCMPNKGLCLRNLANKPLCKSWQAVQLQPHASQHDGVEYMLQMGTGNGQKGGVQ